MLAALLGSVLGGTPGGAWACAPRPGGDWLDRMPTHQKRVEPADCSATGRQPLFAWGDARDRAAGSAYQLTVRRLGGAGVATRGPLKAPRARLEEALSPGAYEWSVSHTTAAGRRLRTQWRRFSVDGQIADSPLPEAEHLVATLLSRARPRMLPAGSSDASLLAAAQQPAQLPVLNLLRSRASWALSQPLPPPPESVSSHIGIANLAQVQATRQLVQTARAERFAIENLALIGRLDGQAAMMTQARARVLGLAAWSPTGLSSEKSADQAHREILLALAQGLDLLWDGFSGSERAQVAAALRERLLQSAHALAELDREPYDAHALTQLQFLTQALLLALGLPEFPEGPELLARCWQLGVFSVGLWGQDGSHGNGMAYAWYHLTSQVVHAAALRVVAGVDLYQLPAYRDAGQQLIAFTPPAWPQPSAFGDEAETRDLYDSYSAAYFRLHAQLSRSPEDAWYWQAKPANLTAPNDASIWQILLLAADPRPLPAPRPPAQNDWVSFDSGLAAMHTQMSAAKRSSVFFRSSRFGAFNHSHADQNSLVYVSKGQPLLVSAGYYPYYNSPHHKSVRATRYKNALSFDGGFGQSEPLPLGAKPGEPFHSMDAPGTLIGAQRQGTLSAVTGDATAAYRAVDAHRGSWLPLLRNAVRSVVMDKANGLTLVYDWASSSSPRQWELNFHSPAPFTLEDATVRASHGGAAVCLDRHGPAMRFAQTADWEVPPEHPQPAQSHGRFTALEKSREFVHLTVLREDCRELPIQISRSGTQISVLVAGRGPIQFDKRELKLPD